LKPRKTIIICPLNWGLGHATRDIPIALRLIKAGCRVVVATESPLLELFKEAHPEIELEYFPGPKIGYQRKGSLMVKLLTQMPKMIGWMFREKHIIKNLVRKYNPDFIISDNRYGARHPQVKSIIITHQLMIKLPALLCILEYPLHLLVKRLLLNFNEIWIPDFPLPHSLAGDLVHKYPLPGNAKLIGPLSRFMDLEEEVGVATPNDFKYDLVVILSGPEPQRSILQDIIVAQLKSKEVKTAVVLGKPESGSTKEPIENLNITIYNHLPKSKLHRLIKQCNLVICRSGYSSLMDLWFLNKRALLIPTPGQTEQEYLALYNQSHHFITIQNQFKLPEIGFTNANIYESAGKQTDNCRLNEEIIRLINSP